MPHMGFEGSDMDGSEAQRLRRASKMSQSEFGAAIGVSRETIGRIERSPEQLDRRTELAMRYVAEGRLARVPELREIYEAVDQVLDQASVRGAPPYDYRDRLQAAEAHWGAKQGGSNTASLIRKAQGVLGMLNVTPPGDPLRDRAVEDLLQLKREWRAASPIE
jgi:DNA-binding XRE family transcriptional regulator